jgi:hypothetical protein
MDSPAVMPIDTRELLTYSSLTTFRNCRKKYFWRIVEQLVPQTEDPVLGFGSLVHLALKCWYETRDLEMVRTVIDQATSTRVTDERRRRDWHLATAMLLAYVARYRDEGIEVVALEKTFRGEIVNPETGAPSRSFVLGGKVDGIVRQDGRTYLLEHKTASSIDGGYLERLWTDFQVSLYTRYVRETLGIQIDGVLYNVLLKPAIKQARGETAAEFEARRAELIAKSKTGKSSAKQQFAESDADFQERLALKLAKPSAYHREMLYIGEDQIESIQAEVWELTKSLLEARRRNAWYQNTSYCFHFNKPCPYFQLCRSGGSELVRESFYKVETPHQELREDDQTGETS